MNFFDLHCDSAVKRLEKNASLWDGDLRVNLCKGGKLDKWVQIFAFWTPDGIRGENALESFLKARESFRRETENYPDKIKLCNDFKDVENALNDKKTAALIAAEGGSPFAREGGAELASLYGVKLITLTWNGENELGYGCQSGIGAGLKPAGKSLLRDMERFGIIADVSHLNKAGFYDVMDSGVPVVASHSNCAGAFAEAPESTSGGAFAARRNLDDGQIRILAEREGLIGINFCRDFLPGNGGFEAVYRNIVRIAGLGGENVLAIGSDFDGCDAAPELDGLEKIPALRSFLARRGLREAFLEKLFFGNSFFYFKKVLKNQKDMI